MAFLPWSSAPDAAGLPQWLPRCDFETLTISAPLTLNLHEGYKVATFLEASQINLKPSTYLCVSIARRKNLETAPFAQLWTLNLHLFYECLLCLLNSVGVVIDRVTLGCHRL